MRIWILTINKVRGRIWILAICITSTYAGESGFDNKQELVEGRIRILAIYSVFERKIWTLAINRSMRKNLESGNMHYYSMQKNLDYGQIQYI